MSQSFSYSFYNNNYTCCDNWLRKHGFAGFTPISQVLSTQIGKCSPSKPSNQQLIIDPSREFYPQNPIDEIDPNYLKAIEITRRHQMERDYRCHNNDSSNSWFNYIDVSQIESYSIQSKAPNDDLINDKKLLRYNHKPYENDKMNQYRQLYEQYCDDDSIKKVIRMENELQYSFEKFCDRYQPPFWPILPIRIQWSDE